MALLELRLRCRGDELARCETALDDVGALSVTAMDAEAGGADERAILEPAVGETPVWPEVALSALFAAGTPGNALVHMLECLEPDLPLSGVDFAEVAEQDWHRAWIDRFQPMRFGRRTWIVPSHQPPPAPLADDAAVLHLDPGLAFGSGSHETTALCLEWLDLLADEGRLADARMLDYGCGSGVLALAALRLGAAEAVGIDNDPQALLASGANAERNALGSRLALFTPEAAPHERYSVVVANILASALDELAARLADRVAPGGALALSGILAGQEPPLLARYSRWFEDLEVVRRGDWLRIEGRRRAPDGR